MDPTPAPRSHTLADDHSDIPVLRSREDRATRPIDAPTRRRRPLTGQVLPPLSLRLDERLARGGAGLIYRATQPSTGRQLAVKVIRADKPNVIGSIERELEVLGEIDSPWVVSLEGSGRLDDGRCWLALELLEGPSLAQVLSAGAPINPVHVLRWLRQACLGLAAIHDQGWVHRDIKPSNLVLSAGEEQIKIIDLGIAERIGQRSQTLSGTPDYMPPEQANNRPADIRSDIYSLGCCAYELMTGRHLVPDGDAEEKIEAHRKGFTLDGSGLPPGMLGLIECCLSQDLDDRPHDMHHLEARLAEVQEALVRRTIVPRARRRRHLDRKSRRDATTSVTAAMADPLARAMTLSPAVRAIRRADTVMV